MNRINELIQKLCPDGVEYKKLEEVFVLKNGYTPSKSNPDYWNDGTVPWFRMEDIRKNGRILNKAIQNVTEKAVKKLKFPSNSLIVATTATIGEHALIECDFLCNQQLTCITIKDKYKDKLSIKYCFYYFDIIDELCKKIANQSGGMPIVSLSKMRELSIPVPPLEVQREIVRVLDSFTLLTAELTAELTARKKQYEYYREYLLNKNSHEVQKKKLGEIFEFRNGLSKGKDFFGKGIPFVKYTDVYNHRKLKKENITALVDCTPEEMQKLKVSRGDVFFTRTSETAEDVGWSSVMLDDMEECVFNGFTIKATPKTTDLLPEYCAYCFSTDSFRKYVTSHCAFTTRASLTGKTIAEYEMPIPSHKIQKRIAETLDNFETICNDLNIGLPAEIEARQKQYEFYRNLLLTFAETGDIIAQTDRQTDRQTSNN